MPFRGKLLQGLEDGEHILESELLYSKGIPDIEIEEHSRLSRVICQKPKTSKANKVTPNLPQPLPTCFTSNPSGTIFVVGFEDGRLLEVSEPFGKTYESQMESKVICCALSQTTAMYAACDGRGNLLIKKLDGGWLNRNFAAVLGYVKQNSSQDL